MASEGPRAVLHLLCAGFAPYEPRRSAPGQGLAQPLSYSESIDCMQPMVTTINIDPGVRDKLKGFCGGGISYSEAIQRLMDLVEADRFFASFRNAMDDPAYPWEAIDLDDDKR